MSSRTGIIAAGNWIVDKTKIINGYPGQDSLAHIESEERNNGGGAFNVLCDLAKLGAAFPLQGLGLIGSDAEGDWILDHCRSLGIDTRLLARHAAVPTSYTDVMTARPTGRRTFFHHPGANRHLGPEHFPWPEMNSRLLYLGYLGLLDTLDAPDAKCGTVAAAVLREAGIRGFLRVVDLVSVERTDYAEIVAPALPEIDILICNEVEALRTTGHPTRDAMDHYSASGLRAAAQDFLARGVRQWVVIHLAEGAYARHVSGKKSGRVASTCRKSRSWAQPEPEMPSPQGCSLASMRNGPFNNVCASAWALPPPRYAQPPPRPPLRVRRRAWRWERPGMPRISLISRREKFSLTPRDSPRTLDLLCLQRNATLRSARSSASTVASALPSCRRKSRSLPRPFAAT